LADATAAYRTGLTQREYAEVTLVGKSLGTLAMGHLLTTEKRPANRMRAVWLTPLLRQESLRQQIRRYGGPSLFAIGSADPQYEAALRAEVQEARGGEVVVVEVADHSMDIPGDSVGSGEAVEQGVRALQGFLAR